MPEKSGSALPALLCSALGSGLCSLGSALGSGRLSRREASANNGIKMQLTLQTGCGTFAGSLPASDSPGTAPSSPPTFALPRALRLPLSLPSPPLPSAALLGPRLSLYKPHSTRLDLTLTSSRETCTHHKQVIINFTASSAVRLSLSPLPSPSSPPSPSHPLPSRSSATAGSRRVCTRRHRRARQ